MAERTRAPTPPPTAALDEVPENLRLHSLSPPAAVVTMYLSCGRVQHFVICRQTIEQSGKCVYYAVDQFTSFLTGYLPDPKADARMAVQFSVYLGFSPLSPTALTASVWMLLT